MPNIRVKTLSPDGVKFIFTKINQRAPLDTDGNVVAQGYHLGDQVYKSLGDGLFIDDDHQLCVSTATDEDIQNVINGMNDILNETP